MPTSDPLAGRVVDEVVHTWSAPDSRSIINCDLCSSRDFPADSTSALYGGCGNVSNTSDGV